MSQTITVHSTYTNGNGDSFPGSDECFVKSNHVNKEGANTPGWPGNYQLNGYQVSSRNWSQSPLNVSGTKVPGTVGVQDTFSGQWGNLFGLGYDPTGDNENFSLGEANNDVNNQLTMKLIGQFQRGKSNLAEVYATRQQCANLIGSTAAKLGTAFKRLRSGNVTGALNSLIGGSRPRRRDESGRLTQLAGDLPGQWLALKYGWQPLLGDVYNSVETVRQAYSSDGSRHRVSAQASQSLPNKDLVTAAGGDWGPEITYTASARKVSVKGFIDYRILGNLTHSLSQLGITNPLALAWELIPYSFVVDWFLPIGNFIGALDYSLGLSFEGGCKTFRHTQKWRSRITRSTGTMAGGYTAHWSGGSGQGEGFLMDREVYNSFPLPPLPSFKDPFSPTHMANGLSLLSQAFSGHADSFSELA